MKLFQIMLFGLLIFVFTCTQSFSDLLYRGIVNFRLNTNPNFGDLLAFTYMDLSDPQYILQKIGHFSSFCILTLLVFNWIKKYRLTIYISIGYACLTEVLQLFFSRDGRIIDMFIDSAGVLLGIIIITIAKSLEYISHKKIKIPRK